IWRYFVVSILFGFWVFPTLAADAAAIVKKADEIRFPKEPFKISVFITSHSPDGDPDEREYQVLQKGFDKSVVRTLAPASERGTMMLMRQSDLWVFLPKVSQPVRLPLSQRLTGQVANGDLARANFSGDYASEKVGEEEIDGAPHHVLELTASRKGVTYHRAKYWVNKSNNRPRRVEFYTKSNKLMKVGEYTDYIDMGGVMRPSTLTLTDALTAGEYSVLTYKKLKKRDLADKIFTKQFLRKLDK
ncbi:MAG: outer membrane lipoprotein-sorting protein, partial [Pseudomonadota bacterium]